MTLFLVIVGLTGSVLAFRDELDTWLNPELLTVTPRAAPTLDPVLLRDKAAALYPRASFDNVRLLVPQDRSVEFAVQPEGEDTERPLQFYLDPYTGEKLGERRWGEFSLAKIDIISFLYRLHMSLALPASTGRLGSLTLGVVALVWTFDCFISFYLTLPPFRRRSDRTSGKPWWGRWKPAWLIKLNGGAYRINFDIHRAFGLWTWAMLFVLAWSSVSFNLVEVYLPVTRALFGFSQGAGLDQFQTLSTPLANPKLDWRTARQTGRSLLDEVARKNGFAIEREESLILDRDHGLYVMVARSSLEVGKGGETVGAFDANSGQLRLAVWPGCSLERAGDVISHWLAMLHMAAVFGRPMQVLVCLMGVVITALSVTGVVIWLKKRSARRAFQQPKRLRAPLPRINEVPPV